MKQFKQSLKSQLTTLVMLCVSMAAMADGNGVLIDGVYYNLQNGWSYYYYDTNGNWTSSDWYERAAIVTYDPSNNPWNLSVIDTYQGDLVIPDKVTYNGIEYSVVSLGYEAFMKCKSLTSVQLPSSIIKIDDYAFRECSSLTSVTMPGVEIMEGGSIFYGCNSLESIVLPKSLKSFSSDLFRYMSLTSITIDEKNDNYISVDGILYDKDITKIVGYPAKKGGSYRIPSTITVVSSGSFPNNLSMDELIVPATVMKIESNAFGDNPQIKKLTIEDSDAELTIGNGNNGVGLTDENGNWRDIYPMFAYTLQELYWGRPLKYSSAYNSAFANSYFTKVVFGTNVTYIPKYTFYNCWSLNEVDIKGGLVQWVNFDFSEPYTSPFSSSDMMSMPGMEQVSRIVLFNGEELSGAVVIPDGITSIPSHALQYGCTGITDLTIPSSVTEIADGAFKQLPKLKTINMTGESTFFKLVDNVLYNNDVTKILCFPQLREGEYTMPSTITTMGDYQFYNCNKLTKVALSDKLKTISPYSFANCSSLASVVIPASVETISDHAFENCSYLADVSLEENLKTIGKYAFVNCSKLLEFKMPSTVETLDEHAFENCSNLAKLTLSSNLNAIGQYAFNKCKNITSLTIPASVEIINESALDSCIALTNLVFEDGTTTIKLGKGHEEIKYETWTDYRTIGILAKSPIKELYVGRNIEFLDNSYKGYYESWDPTNLRYSYSTFDGSLQKVTISNNVTKLPGGLFYGCGNIRDVNFEGTIIDWCNITFADQYATPFGVQGMYAMGEKGASPILYVKEGPLHSKVNIPEGATKIGAYAFYGQNGVSSVTIPKTVKTIEPYALQGVGDVFIYATDVITLENTNSITGYIYIVDDAVTNYRADAMWSQLTERIYPMGFLQVKVDLIAMTESPALLPALNALEKVNDEYRISALTNLKICGTMNGWDILMIRNKMPNLRHLDLTEATILDNDGGMEYYQGYHTTANTISPYSFYKLENLRSIALPQNITSIDYSAFEECRNLQEVLYMPSTCTYIGSNAFARTGLTKIEIGNGVKTIGGSAFSGCYNLADVTLCRGLETIEYNAFYNCSNLRKLILPTTLKRIGGNAFQYCYSLTDIDFAEGLTDIEYGAFEYCSSLKDVHLPTSLNRIDGNAFRGCSNLNEVHVPSMLESIGDYAFTGCGLKSVYAYTITPIPINQNTFDYKGVDLYAPDNSFYAYYLNTQWSQFQDVKEFEAKYEKWYTGRYTDVFIDTEKPIRGDEATGYMYPGSGLIIRGNGEQLVKKLILEWNHGSEYPSLIENGNLNVDELAFIMNVYPRRWYFFCFPCDIKIQDLKFGGSGKYVWRYYDPEMRAAGKSGWTNFTGDVLKAGVGYIYQCNVDGTIELPAYNPEYLSKTKGTADDKDVNLVSHEAQNPQDASWNFVGNPNLSYYSLDDMEGDFDSPITVWDDEQQTYTAVVPGDDDYNIHPFQAFFVQKPADSEGVTFRAENRVTFNQATEKAAARRKARATRGVNEKRIIVNVEISDGNITDKTRVVFDDNKSMDYEIGSDASKMLSMAEVPQVYTLDNKNVKYAVNNRPNKNNEVRLGFSVPTDGNYIISAPRMDMRMALKDNATGIIHDFSNGQYTFQAEAGSNDVRFALIPAVGTTGISEDGIEGLDIAAEDGGICVNGLNGQTVNIYNVKGIRMATLTESGNVNLASGTYIVSTGNKTSKIIVK